MRIAELLKATALAVVLTTLLLSVNQGDASETALDNARGQLTNQQKILLSANHFRSSLLDDYYASLIQYASPDVIVWFSSTNNQWWPDIPDGLAWQRFLFDAQILFTNLDSDPLAIYYSVWSDAYLITEWKTIAGKAKIVDVEIVSGDFLRKDDFKGLLTTPYWQRKPLLVRNAIEQSVTQSMLEADQVFINNRNDNWRELIGLKAFVSNGKLADSKTIVKGNILSNLGRYLNFHNSSKDESEANNIKEVVSDLLFSFSLGRRATFISKNKILLDDDAKEFLEGLESDLFIQAEVVTVVQKSEGPLLFIAFKDKSHLLMLVHLSSDKGKHKPKKIEFIDYLRAYRDEIQ